MNLNYWLLCFRIRSSKLKSNLKKDVIDRLVKKYIIPETFIWKSYNHLFYVGMNYRAYDIFTASIPTILLHNEISAQILLRQQLENYALTEHLLKNTNLVKEVYTKSVKFDDAMRSVPEKGVFWKWYGLLSKITHTLPDGLKTAFADYKILNPSTGKLEPTIVIKEVNHRLSKEDMDILMTANVQMYDLICKNLLKISKLEVQYTIEDISQLHHK